MIETAVDPAVGVPTPTGRPKRARRALAWVVAICVLAAAASIWASTQLRSPADVSIEARQPKAAAITVEVRRGALSDTVDTTGNVAYEDPRQLTVSGFDVPAGEPLVTALPVAPGSPVVDGTTIAEVAGRPIFVFGGPIPMYRDLSEFDSGTDVAQLQAALRRLGYNVRDKDGVFGAATKRAVAAMYRKAGYRPKMIAATTDPSPGGAGAPTTVPASDSGTATGQGGPATGPAAQPGAGREPRLIVPRSEVVFTDKVPGVMTRPLVGVGDQVGSGKALLELVTGSPSVRLALGPETTALVRVGQPVNVALADGTRFTGTVTAIASGPRPGDRAQPAEETRSGQTDALVRPDTALPASAAGQAASATIIVSTTPPDTLSAPVAAVFSGSDGQYVVRVTPDGGRERISVELGNVVGNNAVIAHAAKDLSEHDRLLVEDRG